MPYYPPKSQIFGTKTLKRWVFSTAILYRLLLERGREFLSRLGLERLLLISHSFERSSSLYDCRAMLLIYVVVVVVKINNSCCLTPHGIYLRLSARVSRKVYRGPRKSVDFWGEEKWRQAKLAREFHLASPFRRRSGGNLFRRTQ